MSKEDDHINMRVPPALKAEIVSTTKRLDIPITAWVLGLVKTELLRIKPTAKARKEKK